ncbi:MAG: methyltransferase [Oscillospiraceae bacterium]|jgi:tRNA1(Val) A37 N6-methylase TrmN6|nr:methyltransferase [Oscillospiraceae bacterium]
MDCEIFGAGNIRLFISKEHRFGTDSLLLGEYAAKAFGRGSVRVVCDLCSGCGIIPVTLCSANFKPPKKIFAVEAREEAADLLRRTVGENKLGFIEVIRGDLRSDETLAEIGRGSADLVTANPPYYPAKSGRERSSEAQRAARYETLCTVGDVIGAAAFLLKFGGEFKMCMTAERLTDCVCLMRERGLEPKEIVFIPYGKSKAARLFLISGKKGGKPGVKTVWRW